MIPGDHLQLHYFYWLFSDMLAGRTPFFHNVYEFNTGDDSERYARGNYNVPFSLVYAAVRWTGGRALAWNVTGFLTVWLTYLATCLLLLPYVRGVLPALAGALVGTTLPFRWMALLGGSQTGFAMMWVPLLLLGADRIVRDHSIAGSVGAATALFFTYFNDRQIFLFSLIFLPAWCVLALLHSGNVKLRDASWWRSAIGASCVPAAATLYVVWRAIAARRSAFQGTSLQHGRAIEEVAKFSPTASGLFAWRESGLDSHVYVGYLLPVLLLVGLVLVALDVRRRASGRLRELAFWCLLWLAAGAMVALSLGTNGPGEGSLFNLCRRFVPAFDMIRQPAKIFCLLPTVLAVAVAAGLSLLPAAGRLGAIRVVLPMLAGFLVAAEHGLQVRATVCLIDSRQSGYEAVAHDAAESGEEPRALVVPLWPGDSAWGSLYEHYASLYRIRMLNGYAPVIPDDYRQNVFRKLGAVNLGMLRDPDVDDLLGRGVRHLILHEEAFPRKVSPFPFSFTLRRLLSHPRLHLLKQGGSVWAFRILAEPEDAGPVKPNWTTVFPGAYWEAEGFVGKGDGNRDDGTASGGQYAVLGSEGAWIRRRKAWPHWDVADPVVGLRARGKGTLSVQLFEGQGNGHTVAVDSDAWQWAEIRPGRLPDGELLAIRLALADGRVDVDTVYFASGRWDPSPGPGNAVSLAAPLFFHVGTLDLQSDTVTFRADYEPDGDVFWGPNLPLEPGMYRVQLRLETSGGRGRRLGDFRVEIGSHLAAGVPVLSSGDVAVEFNVVQSLPVNFVFRFARNGDVTVREVTLVRLE